LTSNVLEILILRENKLRFQTHNADQQYNENVTFNTSNQNLNIFRVAAIQYGCQDVIAFLQTKELYFNFHMKFRFFIASSFCL